MKTKKPLDIWDRIDSIILESNQLIQPDEFTLKDYIKRIEAKGQSIGERTAYKHLDALVTSGTLTVRKAIHQKCQTNVFKFTH
jgi:Fe2+ or Zn2+ uptake regulation protein